MNDEIVGKILDGIKENLDQSNYEIKHLRKRLHSAENSIASNFAILAETKANAEWVMNSLDKTTERVKIFADVMEEKLNHLIKRMEIHEKKFIDNQIEIMKEKITSLNKFKSMIFSKDALILLLSLVYFGDKFNIISNFESMKRILGW